MPLIDDRGRLLGRVNLIDFALIAFVLILIPLGYGAYRFLRTPLPRIGGVTPNPLPYKKGDQRIRITGENFRPFLRVTVGSADAKAFLVERRDAAEVVFDGPPAGTYDLALFDFAEELARVRNAVTIGARPTPPVQIVGHFTGDAAAANALAPGAKLPDAAATPLEVVAVQADRLRTVTLRTSCSNTGPCAIAGTPLAPGGRITLHVPGSEGGAEFAIDDLRVDGTWVTAQVRVYGLEEVLELMKAGDVDIFQTLDMPMPPPPGVIGAAVVRSIDAAQPSPGTLSLNFGQGLPDNIPPFFGSINGSTQLPLKTRSAVFGVPVERTQYGWKYRNQYVRPGGALTFVTNDYLVRALVVSVVMPKQTATAGPGQ